MTDQEADYWHTEWLTLTSRVENLVRTHQKLLADLSAALGEQDVPTVDLAPAVAELRERAQAAEAMLQFAGQYEILFHSDIDRGRWVTSRGIELDKLHAAYARTEL